MKFPPSDKWVNHWRRYGIGKTLAGFFVFAVGVCIVVFQYISSVKVVACVVIPAGVLIAIGGMAWVLLVVNAEYGTWGRTFVVDGSGFTQILGRRLEENTEVSMHGPVEGKFFSVICYRVRGRKGAGKGEKKGIVVTVETGETTADAEIHLERKNKDKVALATWIMEEMEEIAWELEEPLPPDSILSDMKGVWDLAAQISTAAGKQDWDTVESRLLTVIAIMTDWVRKIKDLVETVEEGGADLEELKEDLEDTEIEVADWKGLVSACRKWISELRERIEEAEGLLETEDVAVFNEFGSGYEHRFELQLQDWIASQLDEEPPVSPAISTQNMDLIDRVMRELWTIPKMTKPPDLDEKDRDELRKVIEEGDHRKLENLIKSIKDRERKKK